jgi:hypothetical protein
MDGVGMLDVSVGLAIAAHDLAAVVDPVGSGCLGARDVDGGEPAGPVAQEAVGGVAGLLLGAGDLAAVVECGRCGLGDGRGASNLVTRPRSVGTPGRRCGDGSAPGPGTS